MFDWYRNYKAWKAASHELGGYNEWGIDLEDDRSWWKKLTEPYVPEQSLVDVIRLLEKERPELFRLVGRP
jgi:hypothetical protein